MEPRVIPYKGSQISYYCFGSGPRTVICFHGYGEEAPAYEFMGKYAGDQYTFYAIDLPFHGKTRWNEGLGFTEADLLRICEEITGSEDSKSGDPKHILLGFSLGGRVALSLYQLKPDRFERIVLLAPDGLKMNFWYWLATQNKLGNKIFSFTMKHPGWFFGFLKLLSKLKLVDASIFKFVNYYIGNQNVRDLLYQRWTGLRKLRPDVKKIKSAIRENNTATRLLYGKYDRIIRSIAGEKFKKGIGEQCTVSIVSSGHQLLQEKYAEELIGALCC